MSVINRNSGSPVFNTLAEAVAANMTIGQLPVVLGTSAAFDGGGKLYVVLANGSGGTAMNNGNELVAFTDTGAVTKVGTVATLDTGTAPSEVPLNSDGSGIENLNASNLASGTVPSARLNILGTVSQSGGVPTGAIIEEDSNANGEYVKFADGTMICTRAFYDANQSTTILTGGIYVTNTISAKPTPATFSSVLSYNIFVTADTADSNSNIRWIVSDNVAEASTTQWPSCRVADSATTTALCQIHYQMIGKWF